MVGMATAEAAAARTAQETLEGVRVMLPDLTVYWDRSASRLGCVIRLRLQLEPIPLGFVASTS